MSNRFANRIKKGSSLRAFTLAEVLITLGIIGVVAAMTIPSLMQKYQDYQLINAWKDAYSIVSQATAIALKENEGPFTGFASKVEMQSVFRDSFIGSIDCPTPTVGKCWAANVLLPDGSSTSGWEDNPGLILKNGVFIRFYEQNPSLGCNQTYYYSTGECGQIQIDINGLKGPNITGKDVFGVHVLSNGTKPCGSPNSLDITSAANCKTGGIGCGAGLLSK